MNCSIDLGGKGVEFNDFVIEDSDQNLKYLGLLAMSKILKTSPKSVASHKVTSILTTIILYI